MLYYVIFDKISNECLKDKKGNIVINSTIADCIDYLLYVLKIDDLDYNRYEFRMKMVKLF